MREMQGLEDLDKALIHISVRVVENNMREYGKKIIVGIFKDSFMYIFLMSSF